MGGGVVFGPKPRDYSKNVTKAEKKIALRKALSVKILAAEALSVQSVDVSTPKTKAFLANLPVNTDSSVLVVAPRFAHETYLAARNIENVQLKTVAELNAEDLMRHRTIIVSEGGVKELSKRAN